MDWWKQFKKRQVIYGTGAAASVLLVVGIVVVAALLSERYYFRWDATREKTQSLTATTKALLGEVQQPLPMTVFLPEGSGERPNARDLLQQYVDRQAAVSFSFVDPEREPHKAKDAGYRFPGNVLLEYQGRRQMADKADEEAITHALRKILKPEGKKLYFLAGHGERDLTDARQGGLQVARQALNNEGYDVQPLNLLVQPQVPQDAAVIIIAAPQKPMMGNELAALKAYLDRGGRLLVMLEPFQDGGLKTLLARYGVGLDDGIILDVNEVSRALGVSAVMPMAVQYGDSRITQDFKNTVTIYPMARPLLLKNDIPGVAPLPLATTMGSSWEKMGKEWMKSGKAEFDAKTDHKGPFTAAGLSAIILEPPKPPKDQPRAPEKKAGEEKKTYLAVYGSVDFAANAYFNLFANGDLFLNTVNFLAKEEKQIILREAQKAQLLTLTGSQVWTLFLVSLVGAPLIMLVAGVWAYRRRRAARR